MNLLRKHLKVVIESSEMTSRILHGWTLYRHGSSFLRETGWFLSAKQRTSVDRNNKAVPWITYSSFYFIEPLLNKSFSIFEYGSGNSTLYWSTKVKSIVSCEHDPHWYQIMKDKMPENVTYLFRKLENDCYSKSIIDTELDYDIIVIDGRQRNKCATYAIKKLKDDGIIIWDNSERERYKESFDMLKQHGFRCIDFFGMGPINIVGWKTSIFYRDKNCFGI